MNTAILQVLERACDNGARSNINLAEASLQKQQPIDAQHFIGKATAYQEIAKMLAGIIIDLKNA